MSYTEVSGFGAQKTIDVVHHEIHAGDAYIMAWSEVDFDADSVIGIIFTTPDTDNHVNMVISATCTTDAFVAVLEAPTIDTGNYPALSNPIRNRNRNSSNTSGVLSVAASPVAGYISIKRKADPSPVTADGTFVIYLITGGKKTVIASTREESELILKRNTTYYIKIQGDGTGASNEIAELILSWYEHTDKTDQELLDDSYDGQVITRAMRFKSY